MSQLKKGKTELHIVNDKLGTPTYTHDFANNVKHLLSKEYWGLYNIVCNGLTDRFEVTNELINSLGLTTKVKLIPGLILLRQNILLLDLQMSVL